MFSLKIPPTRLPPIKQVTWFSNDMGMLPNSETRYKIIQVKFFEKLNSHLLV